MFYKWREFSSEYTNLLYIYFATIVSKMYLLLDRQILERPTFTNFIMVPINKSRTLDISYENLLCEIDTNIIHLSVKSLLFI